MLMTTALLKLQLMDCMRTLCNLKLSSSELISLAIYSSAICFT